MFRFRDVMQNMISYGMSMLMLRCQCYENQTVFLFSRGYINSWNHRIYNSNQDSQMSERGGNSFYDF